MYKKIFNENFWTKQECYKHCTQFTVSFLIGYFYFKVIEYTYYEYYYPALWVGLGVGVVSEFFKHYKTSWSCFKTKEIYDCIRNLIFWGAGVVMLFVIKNHPI